MSLEQPSQHSGDHWWIRWVALLLGAVAVGVVLLVATRDREPSYGGKTLAQCLAELETGRYEAVDFRPVVNPEAVRAIRQMSKSAVPFLVSNLDSAFAAQMRADELENWPTKIPFRLLESRLMKQLERGRQSLIALTVLGEAAKEAYPLLRSLKPRHPTQQQSLLAAMAATGSEAASAISNVLASREFWMRRAGLEGAAYLGTNGAPLVPMLVAIYQDPLAKDTERNFAARALGRIGHPSNQVVTALRQGLTSTNDLIAGNAALGLMLAGVHEPKVLQELAARIRGGNGKANPFLLLSLAVLETNNARLLSLLDSSVGLNPNPKQAPEKVFDEVRQTWTNCAGSERNETFAMLTNLIAMRRTN